MAPSPLDVIEKALADRVKKTVADASLTPAAVMLLLYPRNGEYCILLNKRSEEVEHHKGEISFPGGARDPEDENSLDTALRETEEEMGIRRGDVKVLGQLDDVTTRSGFGVNVYVGTIAYPYPFKPSALEIAEVLEVPVSVLPLDVIEKALADRVKKTVADASLTPAAVMLLLYPRNGEYCILLNKRSEEVEHHKGEISFPGGARDPEDENSLDTALRETEEEMGIRRGDVKVLGQLDDVTTRSGFGVNVYVGTIAYPYPFKPSALEIAEVLEVPVSVLRDPASVRVETRWQDGHTEESNSYAYNGHLIYGATARILQQFLQELPEVLDNGIVVEGD